MTSEDESPDEDSHGGLEAFPEGEGEPEAPAGSLLGAVGQMASAVLAVIVIVAFLVAVTVALRWVFWA